MSGLNGVTWSILRLANWLSGRERREWLAAMAAETEAAGRQSLAWALGCLGAVIKDRLVADRWFLLALAVAPAVASSWWCCFCSSQPPPARSAFPTP